MTLEEFAVELKALLRKARDSGNESDEIGELAEGILQGSWDDE